MPRKRAVMAGKKKKKAKEVAKPYERTEEETVYLQDFQDRRAAKREIPKVSLNLTDDGQTCNLTCEDDDSGLAAALLFDAFGTTDGRFLDGLSTHLINSFKNENPEATQQKYDFMLTVVAGIEPKDQMEAMLAAQMAAVHMQTMAFAKRLSCVETIDQQNSAERAFNKLARTFTTQLEALNRYRGKGQQKMVVEHIHVHEGGQAVVGNIQGGGGENKTEGQPHAKQVTYAPGATLPSPHPEGAAMPSTEREGQEAVPDARWRQG